MFFKKHLFRMFFSLFLIMTIIGQMYPAFADSSIKQSLSAVQLTPGYNTNLMEVRGKSENIQGNTLVEAYQSEIVTQTNDKGRIIVKFKNRSKAQSVSKAVSDKFSKSGLKTLKKLGLSKLDVMKVDDPSCTDKILQEFKKDPNVEYAQLDNKFFISSDPTDEYFPSQWGLNNSTNIDINALSAWVLTKGDSNLVVGVLDTGIDINHTDLDNNIFVNSGEISGNNVDDDGNGFIDDVTGWDFANDDNSVFDSSTEDEHATHVAGIIAAEENSQGVVGVAPNIKIVPLKFIKGEAGYTSDAIEAIEYAKVMGIKVINCSWGSTEPDELLLEEMRNSGILFICAAGNNGFWESSPFYPACFDLPNIISVAAVDIRGKRAYFSNYGSMIDVAAPGLDIWSTLPDNRYGYESGTSMAAPYVTGIVALLKSKNPDITNIEIKNRIVNGVMASDYLKGIVKSDGMVDAYATLVPPALLNLTAVSYETAISLNWDTVQDATGYDVEDNEQIIDNGTATTYVKSSLAPETPYIFKVRAKYGSELGDWGNRILKATLVKGVGAGIRGEYFDGVDLKNTKFIRNDETINFDQLGESDEPVYPASVRWSGRIQPAYTENYTFYAQVTGGVRLWVDDVLLINEWDNQSQNEFTGSIDLNENWKYFIRMEYRTDLGNVFAKLYWSSASQQKEIIPKTRLISTPYIGGSIGTWSDEGLMPTKRYSLGLAAVNNKIYAMGGFDGIQGPDDHWSYLLNTVEEYDTETQQWVQKRGMPTGSGEFAVAAVNGKIYAIGGWRSDGSFRSKQVNEFDPVFNTWVTKASMPTGRAQLSAINVNDKIYAIGGLKESDTGGTLITDAVEEYDPVLDKWTQKASMPAPRKNMAIAEVDGKIYTFGGVNSSGETTNTVEMYDPELDKWFSRASMPTERDNAAAAVLDGKIYVIGGYIGGYNKVCDIQYVVEEYDPLLDKWTRVENIPTPRTEFGAVSVNGKIYAIGGRIFNDSNKNDYALNAVECFDSNRQKLICGFSVEGQVGVSTIDQSKHTVEFTMPYSTDVTALSPIVAVSSCASVSPGSEEKVDFTEPVTYIVTAGDGTTQEWVVSCIVEGPNIVITSLFADKASPPINTAITWTCAATGGILLQYEFYVYTVSTGWVLKQAYSTNNQFTWTPDAGGDYTICVWVKDILSKNKFDMTASANYTVFVQPVCVSRLTADKKSPQPINTAITWICAASGGNTLQYEFYVYTASTGWKLKQAYSTNNKFTWTPETSGDYTICAWVKDASSSNKFDMTASANYIVNVPQPVSINGLTADKTAPQPVNTAITWTCTATGGTSLQYEFYVYTASTGWKLKQAYSVNNKFIWTPDAGGDYTICVWVKDASSQNKFDLTGSANYTVVGTQPVCVSGLTADKASPQPVNTAITWTCTATGGTSLQYEFYVYTASTGWKLKQTYSTNNKFTWMPDAGGDYTICVWVKDALSQNKFDLTGSANYTVIGTQPIQIIGLTTDKASPQPINTSIIWTCAATGGTSLQYEFYVYTALAGWKLKQAYSTNNQFIWTPEAGGDYTICVWVKDALSQNNFDLTGSVNYTINST